MQECILFYLFLSKALTKIYNTGYNPRESMVVLLRAILKMESRVRDVYPGETMGVGVGTVTLLYHTMPLLDKQIELR